MQIDESKVGKRKYHCGHREEGNGCLVVESRKCFLVPVEPRSDLTLLPIITKWIEPGTFLYRCVGSHILNYQKMDTNTKQSTILRSSSNNMVLEDR